MKEYKKLPAIEGGLSGCLNCGYPEDELSLDTRLYSGFGGWDITKDGTHFFSESNDKEYDESKPLKDIECLAKLEPKCDWRANLNLPLRNAVYQRQGEGKWVLVEQGQGFA